MRRLSIICFFSFSVTVSFSQVKTNFTQQEYSKFLNESCIPKDIKADGYILVIQSPFKEKQTKENSEITEIFETYYKGKFIVVADDSKDFYSGAYIDNRIYKYSISVLATFEGSGNIQHKHYRLSITDRLKFWRNLNPLFVRDSLKKRPDYNEPNKYTDSNAICYTGLEDAHKKLNKMLAFLAEKLGESK